MYSRPCVPVSSASTARRWPGSDRTVRHKALRPASSGGVHRPAVPTITVARAGPAEGTASERASRRPEFSSTATPCTAWFADQQTWDGWNNTNLYWSVWRLALAAARWDKRRNTYVDTTVPKHLQADLVRAALHGTPPPAHVLPTLLQRIRADHHIDRPRIALLRLALTRNTSRYKELSVPQLNPTSTEPGYVCGRIMAMLEGIQRKAMPKVNATITDKYLTTAVVSPRSVLTRLRIGAHPHLRTIASRNEQGARAARAMENRMRDAFDLLDALPAHLNTEQQALFILGYEHQRAHSARAAAEAIKARGAGKNLTSDQAADAMTETVQDTNTTDTPS